VFTKDPRKHHDAALIDECDVNDKTLDEAASGSSGNLGRGGMNTKIKAARLAARSGADTIITDGLTKNIITRLAANERLGTRLSSLNSPISQRKQWLSGSVASCGQLIIDQGAEKKLLESGSSLLPIGVTAVSGEFSRGDLVSCLSADGREVARGLTNYTSQEANKIIGQASDRLSELLGYGGDKELIHRDNLVLV